MGPAYDIRCRGGHDGEGNLGARDIGGCGEEGECGLKGKVQGSGDVIGSSCCGDEMLR